MATSLKRCLTLISHEYFRLANDLRAVASFINGFSNNQNFEPNLVPVQPCLHHAYNNQPEVTHEPSILDSIFDSFLLAAVPKSRRSVQRRMTRRMQMTGHFEFAMPRQDLLVDQHTGMWKEKGTVCRNHYERVKAETKRMMDELGESMKYTADQKEVVFLYEGEEAEQPKHNGKYIVEIKKPRPSWFCRSLLEKS